MARMIQKKNSASALLTTIPIIALIALLLIFVFFLFTTYLIPAIIAPSIAVVNINIPIIAEDVPSSVFSDGVPGSETIAKKIKEIDADPEIGAVVFVINSGGGSVVGTREIYDAIKEMKKPKVAYFREVAASGGYYISLPADYIISEPYAITGSIGAITTMAEMSELFDMAGINVTTITSGEEKDMGSSYRPLSGKDKEILQSIVDQAFEDFKSKIIMHRGEKLNMPKFNEAADGRILSGLQAEEIGLVDETGSKKDAINKAAELAGIEGEPRIVEIEFIIEQKGLFEVSTLFNSLVRNYNEASLSYR
ncbi:signal peptide peptidase SppA [Candidatus Micrarchaeota archaeon]|nr:signal peptide peptidase SppA [Candidatus Micrarchaeota archaeon]